MWQLRRPESFKNKKHGRVVGLVPLAASFNLSSDCLKRDFAINSTVMAYTTGVSGGFFILPPNLIRWYITFVGFAHYYWRACFFAIWYGLHSKELTAAWDGLRVLNCWTLYCHLLAEGDYRILGLQNGFAFPDCKRRLQGFAANYNPIRHTHELRPRLHRAANAQTPWKKAAARATQDLSMLYRGFHLNWAELEGVSRSASRFSAIEAIERIGGRFLCSV